MGRKHRKSICDCTIREIIPVLALFVLGFNVIGYLAGFVYVNVPVRYEISGNGNTVSPRVPSNGKLLTQPQGRPWTTGPGVRSSVIPPTEPCKHLPSRSPNDGRWFNFSSPELRFYAYTAFLDDRHSLQSDPVVRIIALANIMEDMSERPDIYCRYYIHKSRIDLVNPVEYRVVEVEMDGLLRPIGMGWQLNREWVKEYIFSCRLPSNRAKPQSVSVLVGTARDTVTSCMPVERPEKPRVKQDFAICVQVAFDNLNPFRLVEWFELQRLLGVSKIGVYDMNVRRPGAAVLRYYADDGLVDLRRSDYISDGASQFLLHGSPVINDCVYRNMYKFNRILVIDFDEVILPKTTTNLRDLFAELDKQTGSSVLNYLFRNQYFFMNSGPVPGSPPEFTIMSYRSKAPESRFGYATKSAIVPETCIQMHNHFCWGLTPGFSSVGLTDANPNLAVNQHYKMCHLTPTECQAMLSSSVRDDVILKYESTLMKNVKAAMAAIKEMFKGEIDPFDQPTPATDTAAISKNPTVKTLWVSFSNRGSKSPTTVPWI